MRGKRAYTAVAHQQGLEYPVTTNQTKVEGRDNRLARVDQFRYAVDEAARHERRVSGVHAATVPAGRLESGPDVSWSAVPAPPAVRYGADPARMSV